jgi:hypothetical protein
VIFFNQLAAAVARPRWTHPHARGMRKNLPTGISHTFNQLANVYMLGLRSSLREKFRSNRLCKFVELPQGHEEDVPVS